MDIKNTKDNNKILELRKLKEGMIVDGVVKNIKPYGAFIEMEKNGITGFLRIDDISVSRIKTPKERLNIGQNVKIMIKSIEEEKNRINFTYKELLGNWEENAKLYKEKSFTKGIVKGADKFKNGLFIELTPNLVGMAEYQEGYEYGQEVNVFIKKIIKEKKKIKLSIVKNKEEFENGR
ncbi:MAG: S1 RNA-binding domain-containing protein [Candidatus Scatovivens sp.]